MWKWLIFLMLALLVIAVLCIIGITAWVQAETPFRRERLGGAGRAKALILYHPSKDAHFSDDITMALAHGFEADGFAVERWTMSRHTPARPRGFAIIAVVSNTFFWAPDWPTQDYLDRADLGGQNTIAIMAGGGNTRRAQLVLMREIQDSGATLLTIRELWTSHPSIADTKPGSNREQAMQIARQIAQDAGRQVLMRAADKAAGRAGRDYGEVLLHTQPIGRPPHETAS